MGLLDPFAQRATDYILPAPAPAPGPSAPRAWGEVFGEPMPVEAEIALELERIRDIREWGRIGGWAGAVIGFGGTDLALRATRGR